jgi:hypothetical protein
MWVISSLYAGYKFLHFCWPFLFQSKFVYRCTTPPETSRGQGLTEQTVPLELDVAGDHWKVETWLARKLSGVSRTVVTIQQLQSPWTAVTPHMPACTFTALRFWSWRIRKKKKKTSNPTQNISLQTNKNMWLKYDEWLFSFPLKWRENPSAVLEWIRVGSNEWTESEGSYQSWRVLPQHQETTTDPG